MISSIASAWSNILNSTYRNEINEKNNENKKEEDVEVETGCISKLTGDGDLHPKHGSSTFFDVVKVDDQETSTQREGVKYKSKYEKYYKTETDDLEASSQDKRDVRREKKDKGEAHVWKTLSSERNDLNSAEKKKRRMKDVISKELIRKKSKLGEFGNSKTTSFKITRKSDQIEKKGSFKKENIIKKTKSSISTGSKGSLKSKQTKLAKKSNPDAKSQKGARSPRLGTLKVVRKEIPCDLNQLYRKDLFAYNLNQMIKKFPGDYNFFPKTWLFPEQQEKIIRYARFVPNLAFIIKPNIPGKIRLTRNINAFARRDVGVCQVFIDTPLLINSHKFCFKFYCLIAWCKPFRIFIYNDGMSRFADHACSEETPVSWKYQSSHITRSNKNKRGYMELDASRKISYNLKKMRFTQPQIRSMWDRVDDIAIKTIIAGHPLLKTNYHKFLVDSGIDYEVLSLDIMMNTDWKLYLVDVNQTPIVHPDFNLDKEVSKILYDMFVSLDLNHGDKTQKLKKVTLKMVENIRDETCGTGLKFNIQNDWENERFRNFRQIYPSAAGKKYDKFLKYVKKVPSLRTKVRHSFPINRPISFSVSKHKHKKLKRSKSVCSRKRESSSSSNESDVFKGLQHRRHRRRSKKSRSRSHSDHSSEITKKSMEVKIKRVGSKEKPRKFTLQKNVSQNISASKIPFIVSQNFGSTSKYPAVISRSNFTSFSDLQSKSVMKKLKKKLKL